MTIRKNLIAAVALTFAAVGSFAQEATSDRWMNEGASQTTRAQVQAEAARARAAGELKVLRAGYLDSVKTPVTRAEVVAATLAARQSGEQAAIDAEVPGSVLPPTTSVRSVFARR